MLSPTAVAQLFVMGELNRADFFAEFPDLLRISKVKKERYHFLIF